MNFNLINTMKNKSIFDNPIVSTLILIALGTLLSFLLVIAFEKDSYIRHMQTCSQLEQRVDSNKLQELGCNVPTR